MAETRSNLPGGGIHKPSRPHISPQEFANSAVDAEPLSLAEEIAEEADRGLYRRTDESILDEETHQRYEAIKQGDIHIAELQRMSMPQLIEQARAEKLEDITGIKKQDLIFKILK